MHPLKSVTINALARVLPTPLKNSLLHLAFHLAWPEFQRFAHDYSFAPDMEMGLSDVARRGLAPATIIDVGAFRGDWSRIARRVWPEANLHMVEPDANSFDAVDVAAKELGATLHCELLGADNDSMVQFNIMGSGSSVMNERSPLQRVAETRQLRRLDRLVNNIEAPALLKIDAQGYELEILKGSTNVLGTIEAVLLEISLIEVNEGAPLLHDVIAFMKALGFVAYDLLEMHRRPLDGALNQIDIIFLREGSGLLADKRHFALGDA